MATRLQDEAAGLEAGADPSDAKGLLKYRLMQTRSTKSIQEVIDLTLNSTFIPKRGQ
jgi:hypothetical protein